MSNAFSIRSTKIGNSVGFRLPAEFYRENPQFSNADGWIEVLSPDTAIIRIVPQVEAVEEEEDALLMSLFLDFAMTEALKNQSLQPYSLEMSEAAHELLAGVEVDDK